jgi:protein NrfC
MAGKLEKKEQTDSSFSRRDFIKHSGMAVIGVYVLGCDMQSKKQALGFLLLDMKKCQGCISCMLACSLAHEGVENPSLSRIQVLQNPYGKWPNDITVVQCRQCVEPACAAACPADALKRDAQYDNILTVDIEKCIGCKKCINACPYPPSRAIWNYEGGHSQKCDLCANTPHWNAKGGLDGKKACVEVCPVRAIVFTPVLPSQEGDEGYNVNLRGDAWGNLGFPTD